MDFSGHSRTEFPPNPECNEKPLVFMHVKLRTSNLLNWGLHQRCLLLKIRWRTFYLTFLISCVCSCMQVITYFLLFYHSVKHFESLLCLNLLEIPCGGEVGGDWWPCWIQQSSAGAELFSISDIFIFSKVGVTECGSVSEADDVAEIRRWIECQR